VGAGIFSATTATRGAAHADTRPGGGPQQTHVVRGIDLAPTRLCASIRTEKFESFALPDSHANVRQLAGRKGKVWVAESKPSARTE
jgi:hypothetical protein